MAILILINVQYLQNVVFSFEKCWNGQNHYLSDSHHPIKKSPAKFYSPHCRGNFIPTHPYPYPYYLTLFGKPCNSTENPLHGHPSFTYFFQTATFDNFLTILLQLYGENTKINSWEKVISSCLDNYKTTLHCFLFKQHFI